MASIANLMKILKASGGRGKGLASDLGMAAKSSFGKGAGVSVPGQSRMQAFGKAAGAAVRKAPTEAKIAGGLAAAGGLGAAGLGAKSLMSDEDDDISEYLKKKRLR